MSHRDIPWDAQWDFPLSTHPQTHGYIYIYDIGSICWLKLLCILAQVARESPLDPLTCVALRGGSLKPCMHASFARTRATLKANVFHN